MTSRVCIRNERTAVPHRDDVCERDVLASVEDVAGGELELQHGVLSGGVAVRGHLRAARAPGDGSGAAERRQVPDYVISARHR